MSRQSLSRATDLFHGAVAYARANSSKPGIPASLPYRYALGVVSTADADGACASQSVSSGVAALINGALAVTSIATFTTPRNVVAAWTGTAILTIVGTDQYGSVMTETTASGTSHTGKKAFKTITSVTPNASITGCTVGEGVVLGLPFRADINGVFNPMMDNAVTTVTFVPAVTTDPATGTTGDVRGTVTFASAPDGTRNYSIALWPAGDSTKLLAYGIKQFGSSDSV